MDIFFQKDRRIDFSKDDFKSLLFYLGMLTIDKSVLDRVILKVPNYAIKGLYFNYFMKKLNEALDYELDTTEIEEAINQLKEYSKSEELMGLPNLKKWAIVFVNDKCVVNMEITQ